MNDLKFIKNFQKIHLQDIAKKEGIATNNLYTGQCSYIKIKKVRKAIECEIAKLYINEYEEMK